MQERVRRAVTGLGIGLCALAGVAALAGMVAAILLLHTAWGRERVARIASREVSAAIGGALRIGAIEHVDLPRLSARDVSLVAPDGVPAIAVERADVELDLAAIARGTFAFERADVRGGVVRVLADARGRTNMELTFASAEQSAASEPPRHDKLDLRGMATSGMTLIIEGKGLPSLLLTELVGIMRVHVLADGRTELRFDGYRGRIVRGLPTGELAFRDVRGMVQTERKRLLRFDGAGESEGEPVRFRLDIAGEPEKKAVIDATFARPSAEALSTRLIGAWSRLTGGVRLRVHRD